MRPFHAGPGLLGPVSPGPAAPTAVLLLAGSGDRPDQALSRWCRERPADERWAVVLDDARLPRPALPDDPSLRVAGFAGGCACCVAAAPFSMLLARLLRQGPWHRLLIRLADTADPAAVIDALRAGPLAAALGPIAVVAWPAPGQAAPRATDLVLGDAASSGLAALPGWALFSDALARACDPHRWRWFTPPGPRLGWVWPATLVFERRAIEPALRAVAGLPGVAGLRAELRTAREWYGFDAAADPDWAPADGRAVSRVECRLAPGALLDEPALRARWQACLPADAPLPWRLG
ncbi:MAG: hypothetical protein KGQ67_08335 [Betaproteobacteria bacterium]|nr:hypothetical protein [Betaproteobacteria bacterium]